MKRFLIYVIVLIGVLFIGFTTFYFVQNKESLYLKFGTDSMLQYNAGETFTLDDVLVHTQPNGGTTIDVASDNTEVLSYTADTKTFLAKAGGLAKVTITTSNANFDRFTFSVHVGDGTPNNPYFIKTAEQLASIGTNNDWTLANSYQVANSIDLNTPTTSEWTPIGGNNSFTGTFDGGNYEIYNLKITTSGMYAGLFSIVGESGRVENVNLVDAVINGSFTYAGTIAGINYGKVGLCSIQNATIVNSSRSITGGIVGLSSYQNSRSEVYMSTVENLSITANHIVGGAVGRVTGGVTTDIKVTLTNMTTDQESTAGGIVGLNSSYQDTEKYRHSMLKNSLAIISQENLGNNVGAILGKDQDTTNEYGLSNIYQYNLYSGTNISGFAGKADQIGVVESRTTEQLYSQASYTNYDFNNVWTIQDGSSIATIDFSNTYAGTSIYDPGNKITSTTALTDALEMLIASPSSDTTYEIELSEDTVYTMNDFSEGMTTWTPIGTESNPFKGKLIVTGDHTLTLKGFVIEDQKYAGFFGYTDGTAEVSGIIFEDFKISNSTDFTSDYTGTIIAYALTARVSNCTVTGLDITTGNTIGGAIGYLGNGSATNITVQNSATEAYANRINYTKGVQGRIGGVIGINNNATVDNLNVLINTSSVDAYLDTNSPINIGGVIGENNGTASNLYNEALIITENSAGTVYAGGVVGTNRGRISLSTLYVNMNLKDNSSSYVGGLVGANESGAEIRTSYIENVSITGTYIGGLAGTNAGTITESYSAGSINGKFIGGLASISTGNINNCYTLASLSGQYDEGSVSGLVNKLKDGKVEYCFSSATIAGKGSLYAETSSAFRMSGMIKFFTSNTSLKTGELSNCIIVNYGTAERQSSGTNGATNVINQIVYFWEFWHDPYKGWIDCQDADCKGTSGYKAFVDNKFSSAIWNFDSFEDTYPTLKNIPVEPEDSEVAE